MRLLKQLVAVAAVAFVDGLGSVTGGDFGPEASPYAVLFGLLLTIGFMWLARGGATWSRSGAAPGPTRPLRPPSDRSPPGPGPVASV